jgi:predicted nucleotidyltransferase
MLELQAGEYYSGTWASFRQYSQLQQSFSLGYGKGQGYNRQKSAMRMIDEKSILDLRDRIAAEFRPQRIILFGSYAHGNPRSDSDLDILVILGHDDSGSKKAAEILGRLNPSIPVDLIVRTPEEIRTRLEANDFFLAEVMNHGQVLYEAPDQ